LVYAGFRDGAIGIFEAESLRLQCRIAPSAYIPSSISRYHGVSSSFYFFRGVAVSILVTNVLFFCCLSIASNGETVYPTVVATHPWKPNQIAVGMSDGAVHVLEPLHTDDGQVESDASSE